MATNGAGRPRPRGSGFELYSWLFMRISGVLMLIFLLGHLYIMHIINSVEVVNYNFVAARWGTPLWRTWDLILLLLAALHGSNGLRILIDDYIHSHGWRVVALAVLYVLAIGFILGGSLVLFTFQPVAS